MQNKPELNTYLSTGIKQVGGWCLPKLWNCIEPLVDQMYQDGDVGDVAEIGVFKGKFLIGLAKTLPDSLVHAIDVFDDQHGNVDNAGVGSLEALQDNMHSHGVNTDRLKIYQADSSTIDHTVFNTHTDVQRPVSLFSIDGCHTVEHTTSDTLLAMAATKRNGLIFIDDYTNPMWPGVQESIARLYICSSPMFVPLA
ncbi:MAG: class I SAM-dependent methyltransferase, partial [Pseudomonadota bacterium]